MQLLGKRVDQRFLSGGTPPYVVQLQTSPTKGVNLLTPSPFDTTVIFEITKDAAPGMVPVVVMDATKPPRALTVSVEILPNPAKTFGDPKADDGPASPQSSAATNLEVLAKQIDARRAFKVRDDLELSVVMRPVFALDLKKISFSLTCKPKPTACLSQDTAKLAVLSAVGARASMASALNLAPTAGCVCAK